MKVIMFVDDEKLITRSLEKIFTDGQYKYVYVNSGRDALDYLEENHVDLICTDVMMPDMDGFELLEIMKKAYPRTTRIAMTSFNNNNQIRRLVEENLAQFYVFKPWKDHEFIQNIHKIINMQRALYTREMLRMINNIETLPTLPSIYMKLTEMIIRDCNVEKISGLIEGDPSVSATVLRVANSAYYGRRTGNLSAAIMNIGLNDLKTIVLAHTVFDLVAEDETMLKDLWKKAALTNKVMTGIYSECLDKPVPALYASAGLLHDIGRLVLMTNEPDYLDLMNKNPEKSTCEKEKERFGVSHQELGGYLLNSWDLPFAYVESAMYHHSPSDFRIINRELVAVVHLAHHYTEILCGEDYPGFNPVTFEILNVEAEIVEALIEQIKEKI